MTGPVLAACDGHAHGVTATAALLARLLDTDVVAATAYTGEVDSVRFDAASHAAEQAAAHAPGDVAVRPHVLPADDIPGALLALAAELDAAVIVLGPDERGHVTEAVLRRARCPVAVAPADPLLVPERIGALAAAFDATPGGRTAVLAAQRIGELAGVAPRVIAVTHQPADELRLRQEAHALAAPLDVHRGGRPEIVLRWAGERADLLVCGSRGRGRLTAALLGSVSSALVADPPCPVVVVPHALRRDARRPLGVGAPPTLPLASVS